MNGKIDFRVNFNHFNVSAFFSRVTRTRFENYLRYLSR